MTNWELIPVQGLSDLKLGEEREAVRQRFRNFRVFRRTSDAPETDLFATDGLLVTYGSGDRVTFIELASPADPTIKGVHVLGRDLGEVLYQLRERGVSFVADQDGANVQGWGVGLYAPSGVIEGVSIGE
jgi:hypothetical protein